MARLLKIIFGIALIATIGIATYSLIFEEGPLTNVVKDAKAGAANALLDASGAKEMIQDALDSNAESIASALGTDVESVHAMIDDLDISSWQAMALPDDAQERDTYGVEYDGTSAQITLYDDPSYATVEAYGQDITLSVPESAQQYLPYLSYL